MRVTPKGHHQLPLTPRVKQATPSGGSLPGIATILAILLLVCTCVSAAQAPSARFAGDQSCTPCHKQQSLSYIHTAHSRTSAFTSHDTLDAIFHKAPGSLIIHDPANQTLPGLLFEMEAKDGHYSETAVTGWGQDLERYTEPIDLVIGSGKRGQTYLYWNNDQLFELPVSYWTDGHRWINSPGYDDGTVDFQRPIQPGCLECHTSQAVALSADTNTNRYNKASIVPGIACETCHGPGQQHVASEQSAPSNRAGTSTREARDPHILNPAHFPRDRQIDLCALCHSGTSRKEIAPAFSYVPGEPLANYFQGIAAPSADRPDVHGNQVGLLRRSRCYLSSPALTCSTCHNVHKPEQTAASYSAKCLTCHQWQSCGLSKVRGHAIAGNCIDCHMPLQPTNLIVSVTAGTQTRATMRNHWIKVYPEFKTAKETPNALANSKIQ